MIQSNNYGATPSFEDNLHNAFDRAVKSGRKRIHHVSKALEAMKKWRKVGLGSEKNPK